MRRLFFSFMVVFLMPGMAFAQSYVGSAACTGCHGAADLSGAGYNIAEAVSNSGHPYKLNKVEGGVAPTYPFSAVPNPPASYTWNDVSYVIGGYGWKARFLDLNGYIVTGDSTATTQYNLETQGWVGYHAGETHPYDCGACHTTGWVAHAADSVSVHQDGLPGIYGSWSEPGIQCEACHGPGSVHASSMSAADISKVENCSDCHVRGDINVVDVSGGFIRHHEQYEELISSGHESLDCTACHNPHKSARYDQGGFLGIDNTCATCHTEEASSNEHNGAPNCVNCHMPEASKSAVASNEYNGDVKTHVFKINTNAVPKDSMFTADGGALAEDAEGESFVTLDFACYSCHKDESDVGGQYSNKTLAALALKAADIHGTQTGISTFQTDGIIPADYRLEQNYPNPFNPATTISFSTPKPGSVFVAVFSLTGKLVKVLENGYKSPGNYITVWDGTNQFGAQVASGVYIYSVKAGTFNKSMKMVMLR